MIEYIIKLRNPAGVVLHHSLPTAQLKWVVSEMQVGNLSMVIPGDMIDTSWITDDSRIELWRRVDRSYTSLIGGQWLIDRIAIRGRSQDIAVDAVDFNGVLDRRTVDYPAATPDVTNAYSAKTGNADNLIKAFVRENIGATTTDTARRLADLTVTADTSLAPSTTKHASRKNLLTTLQDLAADSRAQGTYLTWGWSFAENAYTFDTRINQWGVNHGSTSADTIIISQEHGNLLEPEIIEDYSAERNVIKIGGLGEGDARVIGSATGTRAAVTPFSRKEYFTSGTSTDSSAALTGEANTELQAQRARRTFTGRVAETNVLRFGVHFNYGDLVIGSYAGRTFDCHLDTISAEVVGGIETNLDIRLHGEEAI